MLTKLQRTLAVIRRISLNSRLFNTTSKAKGGHGHGHGQAARDPTTLTYDQKYERGYFYRELANLEGKKFDKLTITLNAILWYWLFYNFWKKSEDFFGHVQYPDPAKWTDAELGIPPEEAD